MKILLAILTTTISLFAISAEDIRANIKTQNIYGNFTQTKILVGFPNAFKSYGNFSLKESELIWHTLKPINAKVIIGEDGIFEQRGEGLVKIGQNFDKKLFLSIIRLDIDELKKEFDIQILSLQEGWKIDLKPKNILFRQIFSYISVFGDKFVEKIELAEVSGDKTINEFYDIR